VVKLQEEIKVNTKEWVALDNKLFLDEFNDAILDEIIELPSIRELNHILSLVTDVTLVSGASYHLFLA
jgi:hypothetical protein